MTTDGRAMPRAMPRAGRARSLRDDLLDDLRQAAPMPAVPPTPEVPVPDATAADVPDVPDVPVPFTSVRPTGRPDPSGPGTPTLELRVTPRLSWGLHLKTLGEGPGFVLGAGPVQISLTGFRR